jgi:hypothetical protein
MYCGSKILQCVDWVVLFAEDTFLYSLNLVSISLANFIINDSNYFINKLYLSDSVTTNTSHNLFIAAVVTQFYYLTIYLTPYFDTYFRDLLTSFESNSLYCMHPEILIACKNNDNNFIYYLCEFHMSIYMKYFHETVNTYGVYFAELMVILMVWVFLVLMFYTYYLNPTTNESLIDHDYIASSVTIESEEELGSLDDFLAISMLLISMFF